MSIVGYTYEANVHCDSCAADRFGRCACDHRDVHGEDQEGNEVHPIFACDEGVAEMICGDCYQPIVEQEFKPMPGHHDQVAGVKET